MKSDQNIKNNLSFLDDVIKNLIEESAFYTLTFSELYEKIFEFSYECHLEIEKFGLYYSLYNDQNNIIEFEINLNSKAAEIKLLSAVRYLNKNGFVHIDEGNSITASFDGIIMYSKSFKKEFEKQEQSKNIEKLKNIFYIIALLISFAIGVYSKS